MGPTERNVSMRSVSLTLGCRSPTYNDAVLSRLLCSVKGGVVCGGRLVPGGAATFAAIFAFLEEPNSSQKERERERERFRERSYKFVIAMVRSLSGTYGIYKRLLRENDKETGLKR